MAIAISARRPQTRLGRKPDGISSHLQREPKHGYILLHHYLVSVTFLRRITLSPFYQTWADIKREALQSITLSTTAPDDSILPKIDDLIVLEKNVTPHSRAALSGLYLRSRALRLRYV
jgi:hypothetical protein